ncbi:MAG TPA: IPT/TIG domain-containing protein [Thermoanaerobaculia bacterium]|nr:IPT/TIG domain-containing protein [Thermoanaerobaculia bacterium]
MRALRPTPTVRRIPGLALSTLLLLVAACSSDSPTEPDRNPGNPPGTGGGGSSSYNVTVSVDPGTLPAGSTDPVTVTVQAQQSNGAPPPNGTVAVITASAGSFGTPEGPSSVNLPLTGGTTQVTYFVPAEAAGAVTIQATVAGSVGRATINLTEAETFFISEISPSQGSTAGGDTVTIRGTGFEEPVRVSFGGVNAQVLSVTPTQIRVRSPESPGAPNERSTVDVAVTINVNEEEAATDTVTGGFTFTPGGDQQNQPSIFSLTPTTGPNEGGTVVSIIGQGFQSPVQVEFFNGNVALEAEVLNVQPNRIEVRAPSATGFGQSFQNSTVSVRVRNLNSGLTATFTSGFRYGTDVLIFSAGPGEGPYTGGTLVTIFGQGFDAPVAVEAGGLGQPVISVTGTEIVIRTVGIDPPGCQDVSGPISVTNIDTGDSASSGLNFIYRVEAFGPVVFQVTPSSGPQAGGTQVTVRGNNLFDPLVRIGGRPATLVSVSGDGTQVVASTPFLPPEELLTEACDDNADGTIGQRYLPTAVDLTVENRVTSCDFVFEDAFLYNPTNTACRNDVGPPPEDGEGEGGEGGEGGGG